MNETLGRPAPLTDANFAPQPVASAPAAPAPEAPAPRPAPAGRWPARPGHSGHSGHSGHPGRFGRELGYLLSGLPLGLAAFILVVTGFFLGLGTAVIWVGLPILAWTLTVSRYLAGVERERVGTVTGRKIPRPDYRSGGMLRPLSDAQAWRDLVHAVVSLPLRIVGFCFAAVWTVGGVGELLYVTWSWALPDGDETGLVDLMWDVESEVADIAFHTGVGVVLLVTAVPVLRFFTAMQAGLARTLLADGAR